MKRTEMRVALARDVLKQIKASRLRVVSGRYVDGPLQTALKRKLNSAAPDMWSPVPDEVCNLDARDLIKGEFKGKPCSTCAKGALFVAHVLRNDKVTLERFVNVELQHLTSTVENEGEENPIPAFTPRQLDEIEMLFESQSFFNAHHDGETWTRNQLNKLRGYRLKLKGKAARVRLETIMKLIIRNKGRKIVL